MKLYQGDKMKSNIVCESSKTNLIVNHILFRLTVAFRDWSGS